MMVSFAGGGLSLSSSTPGAVISVSEVGSGSCAADLGLLNPGTPPDTPLNGTSILPRVTPLTKLSDLANGAGIDLSGLKIANGSTSATLTLSPLDTVESLLTRINSAGLGVHASISDDGTRINVANVTQGAVMTLGENGGTTAQDLGIRSYSPSTKLSDLNAGAGVKTNANGDLRVTDSNGNVYVASLASARTVQDVIDTLNTATGGLVQASFATNGNGITLTDTAGGTGAMKVEATNYSSAVHDLGLDAPVSGGVLTGRDVNGVAADGVFAHLQSLRKAMLSGDQAAMSAASDALQKDWGRVARIRGQMGAGSRRSKRARRGWRIRTSRRPRSSLRCRMSTSPVRLRSSRICRRRCRPPCRRRVECWDCR